MPEPPGERRGCSFFGSNPAFSRFRERAKIGNTRIPAVGLLLGKSPIRVCAIPSAWASPSTAVATTLVEFAFGLQPIVNVPIASKAAFLRFAIGRFCNPALAFLVRNPLALRFAPGGC